MSNDRATISMIDIAAPNVELGGIGSYSLAPGLNTLIGGGDGLVDPTFAALMTAGPVLSFTSRDIATILDQTGIVGKALTTADVYLQKMLAYATRAGATSHTKISLAKAFLVPRTLTAQVGGLAVMACDMIAISANGTTAPIAVTASQNLPALTDPALAFTCGPCSINGTALAVASISIDFGLSVGTVLDDANIYPTVAYVTSRRPTISITSPDMAALATIAVTNEVMIGGVAQDASDSAVYFAQLDGNTRKAGSTHISFTVDEGRIEINSLSGSDGETVGAEIVIKPVYDGTAAIMAIDTAVALP